MSVSMEWAMVRRIRDCTEDAEGLWDDRIEREVQATFMFPICEDWEGLIDEGAALEHCVGRMDYDRRQAEGRSVICFIRRVGDESTPYVTAEVKVDGQMLKVSQCYGYRDGLVHEVDGFVKGWMKESNKAYRKVRRVNRRRSSVP